MQLDPAASDFRLSAHDVLSSTNTEALMRARAAEAGPLWITARQQTAGRGRQGREWVSTPGNLYATLLVCDPAPPERAPELSFVAALALYDAIIAGAAVLRGQLVFKWPNDILHGMQKLAGILIESEVAASRLAVAIGIGVNCMHHPTDVAYPATDLASAGAAVTAEDLFSTLSRTMAQRLDQWKRGAGFAGIRADWLVHAQGVGEDIRVRLPNRELTGRFETLDEHGRLLLRLADGAIQTVAAGDVFPIAASGLGAH
jgi:BirA family biotin operon repressor/biotin-[acetyl-CoA-carboxylase] ligase